MNEKDIKDILVINPGSTTTKIAIYTNHGTKVLLEENLVHDEKKILEFPTIASQMNYRKGFILKMMEEKSYDPSNLTAIIGRGGMLFGLQSGGYLVNQKMYNEMAGPKLPQHASSLGAMLAYSIARPLGIPAFIYDSTMGCDLLEVAKVTGIAEIEKYGSTHLLNSRAQAIRYAKKRGKDYRDLNFIVCHMGGGTTVNAMRGGKVIDVAAYDDGPMSMERSGGVPLLLFTQLCFDGKHTEEDMKALVAGRGGVYSYLGTKDARDVEAMIEEGDEYAAMIYEACGFQCAKAIASMSCSLKGQVDAIILTGGVAYSDIMVDHIKKYCGHIGPIEVAPGELEMEALAEGAIRMLLGEEEAKEL